MKNLKAKVLTAGLTAAMVLSMGAPVWAASLQVDNVNAVSNDDSAKIAKTLEMAANGVTNPGFTFTFDFTPVTAQTTTETTSGGTGYVLDITKTAGTKASQTVTLNNTTSGTTANAIFAVSEFSEPGIYGYIVEENATAKIGDTTWTGDTDHILTLDSTKYLVRIKVVNNNGTLSIAGISAQAATVVKGEDGKITSITTTGNKIDGGTDEGGTNGTIPFTNKYTEYANDDPTDDVDEGDNEDKSDKGLVIKKTITGEGANTSDKFTYKIEFTADNVNSGLTTSVTNNVKVYSDEALTTEVSTLSDSGTYYFKLGNNEEIDFKVPAGTTYKVTETNGTYSVSTKGYNNGTATTGSNAVVEGTAGEYLNRVEYTNTKTSNPLTGIVNNYGGLIAVVAVAAGGMLVLSFRRRREDA